MNTKNSFLLLGLSALLILSGCTDAGSTAAPEGSSSDASESLGDASGAPEEAAESAETEMADAPAAEEAAPEPEAADPEPATTETADTDSADPADNVVTFSPGPDVQKQVLEELILAEPGAVFEFEEGRYEFTEGLSLTVADVTIRGQGMDKTILSFKNQEAGAEGLYITSDNVVVEDIAIEDTKGNAIKSLKANNIVYRRVRTEWTGGPLSTNGAYGLYPVSSKRVMIDGCVAIGASDAGIYVGQSQDVIVKNSRAEYNVAGIEIENCYRADVFDCEATNNTGGILVFDLPDLPQQRGHDVRVFNNRVYSNNTPNFAPEGNIVGTVPAGTGIEVMANSNVEIFNNEIHDNGTTNMMLISYQAAGIEIKDPNYYPYVEGVHIHHNKFGGGGEKPDNKGGELMAAILGTPLPDIVWDGIVNPENLVDGKVVPEAAISIHSNTSSDDDGKVTFGNLGGLKSLMDPANATPSTDITPHQEHTPPSVKPVEIAGVQ